MKKALKIVGSLLIGAIVGFGIAFLLIWIIDGSAGFEKAKPLSQLCAASCVYLSLSFFILLSTKRGICCSAWQRAINSRQSGYGNSQ